jgi:hypothetical protein
MTVNTTTGMADSTVPQVQSDQVDLHLEFRTLSMLFTAVTTINRGQPSLASQQYEEKYYTRAERSGQRELALNALATILVRGGMEVVAVVADGLQVYAMQDEEQADTTPPDKGFAKNFIKKKKKNKEESPIYTKAETGEPYSIISDSVWRCLHIK